MGRSVEAARGGRTSRATLLSQQQCDQKHSWMYGWGDNTGVGGAPLTERKSQPVELLGVRSSTRHAVEGSVG